MQFTRNVSLALLLLTIPALSQVKETLLIGPGDTVHIQVFETSELAQTTRVSDSGNLLLTLGGTVKLAGVTAEQASHIIEARYRERNYLKDPHVLVSVEDFATQKVSVFGEVHAPGVYSITTARSVTSVLAMAGGLNEVADRHIFIERHNAADKIPYFISNTPQDQTGSPFKISPGDTIFVPKAKIVYILGDVRMPGGYTMTTNQSTLSVLQLLARAGGTNNTAIPSHTRLIRKNGDGTTEERLPLGDMQKGKKPDQQLQADDIIYVPFSYLKNLAVTGAGSIPSALSSAAVYRY